MVWLSRLALLGLLVSTGWAATFGTVVPIVGGASDLVLDEARRRIYLVNPALNQVEVYSIAQRRMLTPIRTSRQPVAAAMSRNGQILHVTCYDGSALDLIDLEALVGVKSVSLPAKPEGVAVGSDERVLITTIGTGAGNQANTLLLYDPQATETRAISNVVLAPPPPGSPLLPPPSGRVFLSYRSQLLATRAGDRIIGLNVVGNNRVVFVYEVASGTVLRSRQVGSISTVLSVSPDGSKFMAGLSLFDTETLAVLAQQNAANAPFMFPTGAAANFNTQQNQGGSVFSPDGAYLFTAFNITPVENPPARANVSQLLVNDPDNLLIQFGIELPENLVGKFVISSDGGTLYALSESGMLIVPLSTLRQYPIAVPDTQVALLNNDQCGVTAATRSATVMVRNQGGGRLRATASLLQLPSTGPQGLGGIGGPGGGAPGGNIIIIIPQPAPGGGAGVPVGAPGQPGVAATSQQQNAVTRTAPQVAVQQMPEGTALRFTYNAAAASSLGTLAPPHTFLIQAPDAVNIPPTVRVYQNNRNSEASADVVPVELGTAILEGLVDLAADSQRRRLYIANSGLNRVEVFDMRTKQFLAPIRVGQLPRSLALAPDGSTLYVANTGGESISIVDLNKGEVVGRVLFPPLPFNASAGVVTPQVIATGLSGLQIVMNDGRLWQVIGNTAVPRGVSQVIGADSAGRPRAIPQPRNMVAAPNGEYILLLAGDGNAYLYDAMADDFVMSRQLFTRASATTSPVNALQGLYGAVAAGPRGQYFLANGLILNQALTPIGAAPTVPGPAGRGGQPQTFVRPVAAVAPVGATSFARLTQPVRFTANAAVTEPPSVEIVDVNTGNTLRSFFAVEGPLQSTTGPTSPLTAISGRTMAVDPSGTTAYVLTASGLGVVPLEVPARQAQPQINPRGLVSLASYLPSVAPGQLVSLFGRNLGTEDSATASPLPTLLGGVCVTANNRPLPLLMTSPQQINAQIPPEFAAGRFTVQVRSIAQKTASPAYALTVSKYAPAVFVDPQTGQAAIYHSDGRLVTPDYPARRDERLVIYATGLGATKGGKVTAGAPAPSNPLAEIEDVQVFFGRTDYRQSQMLVEWSGLTPGLVGVNQINLYVPGEHMKGPDLPVTLRVGGIDSPQTGPVVPRVAVE